MYPFVRWLLDVIMWAFALLGTIFFTVGAASFFAPVDGLQFFWTPITTPYRLAVWTGTSLALAVIGFGYWLFVHHGRFRVSTVLALIMLVAVVLVIAYSGIAELRPLPSFAAIVFSLYWPTRKAMSG